MCVNKISQITWENLMYILDDIRAVHFEPSSLCNARCPVCPRFLLGGMKNEKLTETAVSYEQFKNWFTPEFLTQINRFQMCGNYGDPCTTPELVKICEYISSYNVSTIIHTNGGMRNTEFWSSLAKVDNVRVVFAIDGLSDTNHLYRRGVRWESLMENVKAFISSGGFAQWSLLRFKHNQHQIKEAEELSMQMGFKNFFSKKPFGFMNWEDDHGIRSQHPSMLVLDNAGNYEYELYEESSTNENIPRTDIKIEIKEEKRFGITEWHKQQQHNELSCHAINTKEIFVSSTGQVYPCCFLSGFVDNPTNEYQQEQFRKVIKPYYELLNLNNNSLSDILETNFYQRDMIEGMKPGENRLIGCSIFCTKKPA